MVRRVYVEKKSAFAVEAHHLLHDLTVNLGLKGLKNLRLVNRYDVAGLSEAEFEQVKQLILAEPTVDEVCLELNLRDNEQVFAFEYLPGQYDQRADSAAQCIALITQGEQPLVVSGKVVILEGSLTEDELNQIKQYCINPVEAQEVSLEPKTELVTGSPEPSAVAVLEGFSQLKDDELPNWVQELGLAMTAADLACCRDYFQSEHRDPTLTEIRVLDTYWSDHCRHTTFHTEIDSVEFADSKRLAPIQQAYDRYLATRNELGVKKPVCLMDLAVMAMKKLKSEGKLSDLDASDEINACSIVVPVEIDGQTEDWLVMFKNETHNHPTEIEPFGGAATCLGGCIRDPLSGRSYVYQAMRVTGSGDPRTPVSQTLAGKLPQRKITVGAAAGYSSYGNQIGLATGQVSEVYHPGYVAKRMEIGAVMAAAPKDQVVRLEPQTGDVVLLVGGRTGRDGCGGATGSSKEHTVESLATCGAEVQKGNPPTERKIQRLFRRPEVSRLIKRCNDFGAGGVSVAIGELTESLHIDLDKVPKKYEGLDGTELAISESQERMAVVVAPEDVAAFMAASEEENVEVTKAAVVTDTGRLVMTWRGQVIVDLKRAFLDTNGASQHTAIRVEDLGSGSYFTSAVDSAKLQEQNWQNEWVRNLTDLNVCSQKGLVERFDATIGAGTVLMPFGGKTQLTPQDGMAAKIPVLKGQTDTTTLMTYGFNPDLAVWSPFHGALYSVVLSVSKIVALGGDAKTVRLTLQEYFEKLGQDPSRWGKPFSALLGAFVAQAELAVPAIGGKDSMSGTFMDLTVPPTLVSFAVAVTKAAQVISAELKAAGNKLYYLPLKRDEQDLPDFAYLRKLYEVVQKAMATGQVKASAVVREGGVAAALSKMAFGNELGVELKENLNMGALFVPDLGAFVLEVSGEAESLFASVEAIALGQVTAKSVIAWNGQELPLAEALKAWQSPLENIFPTQVEAEDKNLPEIPLFKAEKWAKAKTSLAKPQVLIPVFPGTNCEYDTARAFEQAGAIAKILVVRNRTPQALQETSEALVKAIKESQILMLPGGFSAGDEPDGSGKFIATMLRSAPIKEAVMELLQKRDGLALGICNGFQALIKLGLVPFGEIRDITPDCPTLTYNTIGRHVSTFVETRIVSNKSPWLARTQAGDCHAIAVSHGEGRFVASAEWIEKLAANGQIATQYVTPAGQPTMDLPYNPNGSVAAIEGITSPDGRVLGKMGHSERLGQNLHRNIPGEKDQQLFRAGVEYFLG